MILRLYNFFRALIVEDIVARLIPNAVNLIVMECWHLPSLIVIRVFDK